MCRKIILSSGTLRQGRIYQRVGSSLSLDGGSDDGTIVALVDGVSLFARRIHIVPMINVPTRKLRNSPSQRGRWSTQIPIISSNPSRKTLVS